MSGNRDFRIGLSLPRADGPRYTSSPGTRDPDSREAGEEFEIVEGEGKQGLQFGLPYGWLQSGGRERRIARKKGPVTSKGRGASRIREPFLRSGNESRAQASPAPTALDRAGAVAE
jgi:hypothetical protein